MTERPQCAECGTWIKSVSLRTPRQGFDDTFCWGCLSEMDAQDLTPGEDFEIGAGELLGTVAEDSDAD